MLISRTRTIKLSGKQTKLYIGANPRFRTLNIKDETSNLIKPLAQAIRQDVTEKKNKANKQVLIHFKRLSAFR